MSELSYLNKPTQLSDKYSRLYETEWTDAFNILTLEMVDERIAIQWLLSILQVMYLCHCFFFYRNCLLLLQRRDMVLFIFVTLKLLFLCVIV